MVESFSWGNDSLALQFCWDDRNPVSLQGIRSSNAGVEFSTRQPIVEVLAAGYGHWLASGRLVSTVLGKDMRYISRECRDDENDIKSLCIVMENKKAGIRAEVTYELPDDVAMFRTWVTITNIKEAPLSLESVTSFVGGFGGSSSVPANPRRWQLTECDNDWLGEGRWKSMSTADLFPCLRQDMTGHNPRGSHSVVSTGSWSTGRYTPLALLSAQDMAAVWLFQIEHNGAWRWEIGDNTEDGYIALSGPTNLDHSWSKTLRQNESFTTVPASVTFGDSVDTVIGNLTAYRRAVGCSHKDMDRPSVIFNDYMNTINGDPTTDKLLPLIHSASQVGVEVFCVDCGWYDDSGDWWSSVGQWTPSHSRFPHGFEEVMESIRSEGMVPGLWIEPEVIGVDSPLAKQLPDSAFFQRNGHRVVEQDRYVLDFRDKAAFEYMDSVIDRLVGKYGIGYFKFDYNVSPGVGSDYDTDSTGDALLEHNRAYSRWIDGIHRRYPSVILENCSSGGMREDFAQTGRFEVQSTSDQQDYRLYPTIAAASPMMMLPEQTANWAYPQSSMSDEEIAFNLNTTMLGRFFLSGYINRMSDTQQKLIKNAINVYKREVQPIISRSVPFWPNGLPRWSDPVVSYGLMFGDEVLLTVWAREVPSGGQRVDFSLPSFEGADTEVTSLFPAVSGFDVWKMDWDANRGMFVVEVPTDVYAARTFKITRKGGLPRQ